MNITPHFDENNDQGINSEWQQFKPKVLIKILKMGS